MDCHGGLTQILGSEMSEPADLSNDQRTQILPTPGAFGTFSGVETI